MRVTISSSLVHLPSPDLFHPLTAVSVYCHRPDPNLFAPMPLFPACIFPPAAGPGAVRTTFNVSRDSTVNYECRAGMTSSGPTELELTCTETGWTEAEMITCDSE